MLACGQTGEAAALIETDSIQRILGPAAQQWGRRRDDADKGVEAKGKGWRFHMPMPCPPSSFLLCSLSPIPGATPFPTPTTATATTTTVPLWPAW